MAEKDGPRNAHGRNVVNLVDVKNSANLERLLRFMGAVGAAEEIHAQKAFKQVRTLGDVVTVIARVLEEPADGKAD